MARLHSLFHPGKIKPEWEFRPGALIWRLFCTSTDRIIGEARDQKSKSVSFFCLDARSGAALWKDLKLDEPWWIGIEAVHKDVLICHGFARPDMPQHKGLLGIDSESGKLLWKNEEFSYWFSSEDKVYGQRYLFEKRIGCALDLRSGTLLNEYSGDLEQLQTLERESRERERDDNLVFPEPYNPDDLDSAVTVKLARLLDGKKSVQSIEHLLHRGLLIVDYYRLTGAAEGEPALVNVLEVFDAEKGKTLHKETIASGTAIPAPDAFFVKDDFLYYIKNRTILKALRLWKS
jgi:hypothetical protein